MRYFIEFCYLGKNYHGWQVQPNANSVQAELSNALTTVLRESILLTGAGRTDTGVHAKQMFAHFDTEQPIDLQKIVFSLNAMLPSDISIIDFFEVSPTAHARFDALSRTYEYHIHFKKNPFVQELSYELRKRPNVDLMNKAAQMLLSHDNFQCFSKSKTEVNNFNCTIIQAEWHEDDERLVFEISANRFLRNMVRAITGTLLEVGFGKMSLVEFKDVLLSKSRSKAGKSVPGHGLFLTKIMYADSQIKPSYQNSNSTHESQSI